MSCLDDDCSSVAFATCQTNSRPARILAIDDDPNISGALERRFRRYDVEVLRAFHGIHGISLATTEKPDLIITDLVMPQGDGREVVECLKGNAETCDIPIIVLTGKPDRHLARQLRDLGIDGYLTKPVNFDELRELVGRFVDLRQRR